MIPEFVFIVAVIDPLDDSVADTDIGHIRYIKATRNYTSLCEQYLRGGPVTSNARIQDLIKHRRVQDFPVELVLLDTVVHQGDDKTWRERHKYWIDVYRNRGHKIENKKGGVGSVCAFDSTTVDKHRKVTMKRKRKSKGKSPYLTNETRFAARARGRKMYDDGIIGRNRKRDGNVE